MTFTRFEKYSSHHHREKHSALVSRLSDYILKRGKKPTNNYNSLQETSPSAREKQQILSKRRLKRTTETQSILTIHLIRHRWLWWISWRIHASICISRMHRWILTSRWSSSSHVLTRASRHRRKSRR